MKYRIDVYQGGFVVESLPFNEEADAQAVADMLQDAGYKVRFVEL